MTSSAYNYASEHMAYTGVPRRDAPVLNEDNTFNISWFRFFIGLWRAVGGSIGNVAQAAFVSNPSTGVVDILNATTGQMLVSITGSGTPPIVVLDTEQTILEALALIPPSLPSSLLPSGDSDQTILETLSLVSAVDLLAADGGNIDGGEPDTIYGGLPTIDGGGP